MNPAFANGTLRRLLGQNIVGLTVAAVDAAGRCRVVHIPADDAQYEQGIAAIAAESAAAAGVFADTEWVAPFEVQAAVRWAGP